MEDKLLEAVLSSLAKEIGEKIFEIDGQLCKVTYVGYPYIFQVDPIVPVKVVK